MTKPAGAEDNDMLPRAPVRDEARGAPAAGLGGWFFISEYNVIRCDNKHTTQENKSLFLTAAVLLTLAAWKSWNKRNPFQPNRIFKAKWIFVKMLNDATG